MPNLTTGALLLLALLAQPWRAAVVEGFLLRSSVQASVAPVDFSFRTPTKASSLPQLTPVQFLFISSPKEGKIVYTQLRNFQSLEGRVFALVDSGLSEPAGLAFDHKRSSLYVADRGSRRIFRYRVLVQEKETRGRKARSLVVDGVQLCIMQGHMVEWVAVDPSTGDVFYSSLDTNTINRIPVDVIEELGQGAYQCGDIQMMSEKTQMIQAAARAKAGMGMSAEDRAEELPTDAPNTQPVASMLYEGALNPHVTVPGGIVSDGMRLYWTNQVNGTTAGSAVQGDVRPDLPLESSMDGSLLPFPAVALTNATDVAYGIARSNEMVFYSTNTSGRGFVYGVVKEGGAHALVASLVQPRGLVWDGDNTVYVADQASSKVWSFPVGRLMDDAPLTQTVAVNGAFGVAMLSSSDPAFQHLRAKGAGLRDSLSKLLLLLLAVACLW